MTLGLADEVVRVVDYDESWPASFAIERDIIDSALTGMECAVEHIGSTSVSGLAAKPIVDIAIGVGAGAEESCVGKLQAAGYEYRGYNDKGGHVLVRRVNGLRTHHLHVVPVDGEQWQLYLDFRAVLRGDPSAREAYAAAKRDLASRFANDRRGYLDGKDDIVSDLLRRAHRESAPPPPAWLRDEARKLYGRDPIAYEEGRPAYPEQVFEILTSRCGLRPGSKVLEVGPGTGRVTERLIDLGSEVVGVEPDGALAAYLKQRFSGARLTVLQSTFEGARLSSDGFDLAVAGASFHWVDQAVGLRKLGRVVRPGGWAAMWWTIFGDQSRPDRFGDVAMQVLGEGVGASIESDRPQFELDAVARCRDLEARGGFVDADHELIRWSVRLNAVQVRALYGSMIRVLRLPDPERERKLDELVSVVGGDFGGVVERPFVTAVYTARRPSKRS